MSDTAGTEYQQKIHGEFKREIEHVHDRLNEISLVLEGIHEIVRNMAESFQRTQSRADEMAECCLALTQTLWYERGEHERLRAAHDRLLALVRPETFTEAQSRDTPVEGLPADAYESDAPPPPDGT